ncbi:PP2C family protein-serine/threonine phosphatase [Jongsikchunia kroppenstedtii]|uniref:PP2C family protein-serine/threonine phosphatase n=1 Tax=Jongsikchunia kroppenstedtii TaxID=1121721 RepID=UPI00035F19C9|nr:protein phosphatase 2C domain-containing protein [Jongsikchunia kroppenstedtii]
MTLVLRYIARSDRGLVRSNNEDSAYAGARLLALADGMGGHAAGEVASQLVIQSLRPLDDDEPGDDLLGKLERATHDGNVAIADQVAEAPELDGMGTTLTAILFAGSRIGLCHVGDSRGYLLRDGVLEQITRDDTFVQTLVEEGKITAEQAHSHPQRSLIMKALTGTEVEPTLTIREARAGDRYLLCSDGLSDVVTEETIADTLAEIEDHKQCADRLIELALRGGGPDNVTVVVADVVDDQYGESRPILGGAVGHDDGDYVPDPSTAAGRAAALRPPAGNRRRPSVLTSDEPHPRRPRRTWVIVAVAVATLLVLVAGAIAARSIIRSSYYVGENNGNVVIYRGLQSDILGIKMHNVDAVTCVENFTTTTPSVRVVGKSSAPADCRPLRMSDLTPAGRNNVTDFKPSSKGNAERAVQALLSDGTLLPACESQTPTPTVTPPPPGAPATVPPPAPLPPGETSPAPTTPGAPPGPATAAPTTTSPAAPSGENPTTATACREQ